MYMGTFSIFLLFYTLNNKKNIKRKLPTCEFSIFLLFYTLNNKKIIYLINKL